MATLRAEVHGPIRIVATGENMFGGRVTIDPGDAHPKDFTGLNTKVFRTTSAILFSPMNSTAAVLHNITVNTTRMHMLVPTNGTLRIFHTTPGAAAPFAFWVFDGGTALT